MQISQSFIWRNARDARRRHGLRVSVRNRHARLALRRPRGDDRRNDRCCPQAGARLQFSATAYCKGETTASGVGVRTGIAAADPAMLPVGSVVRVETPNSSLQRRLDGDGHRSRRARPSVDLYLWSCKEALAVRPAHRAPDGAATGLESRRTAFPAWSITLFRQREAESKKPAPPACARARRSPRTDSHTSPAQAARPRAGCLTQSRQRQRPAVLFATYACTVCCCSPPWASWRSRIRYYSAFLSTKIWMLDDRASDSSPYEIRRRELLPHQPLGDVRPSLRGHHRRRPAGRSDAGGAVRLRARLHLAGRRRAAWPARSTTR